MHWLELGTATLTLATALTAFLSARSSRHHAKQSAGSAAEAKGHRLALELCSGRLQRCREHELTQAEAIVELRRRLAVTGL